MCGVIGLIYKKDSQYMGEIACKLLKMLEYRGYDSTGAIIQDSKDNISLRKDVGAPSKVAYDLGIDKLSGKVFCGQVRWATFGVVTQENAQPHEVKCKTHLYGAHNGNITNCFQLKEWLIAEGHDVKSDNDGEMLVHTVEHFFAQELKYKDTNDYKVRYQALHKAIKLAYEKINGSFAAVIVDPVTKKMAAIKAGSSLYIGQGQDAESGDFTIVSSDLASVLQLTKILIPIKESQFAIYDDRDFTLYDLKSGNEIDHIRQRSLLKVEETKLHHPFKYFMEQEIFSQIKNTKKLISLFTGGDLVSRILRKNIDKLEGIYRHIREDILRLLRFTDNAKLSIEAKEFFESDAIKSFASIIPENSEEEIGFELESSYSSFLDDLREYVGKTSYSPALMLKFIDGLFELENIHEIEDKMQEFVKVIGEAKKRGSSIYILACGTSFHAAKTAPLFFNEIAGISVIPLLPGEFRAQCTQALNKDDIVIGISQSGETKDLIDVFNFVERCYPEVTRVCILNNTNSTLALEKSDLYIPLFCGPEIAVPATKSFLNQLLVLYVLALNVRTYLEKDGQNLVDSELTTAFHLQELRKIPDLIERTIKTTKQETDAMAKDLFLTPSIHILATRILGIAKEGALKIREIVLNHTEGFEGSEFKHGPNTILGMNTVFGLNSVINYTDRLEEIMNYVLEANPDAELRPRGVLRIFKAITDYALKNQKPNYLNKEELSIFEKVFEHFDLFESMYANYPLIFITTPRERDINLTISQINTHKIRGADVYLIAEDNNDLREAVAVAPSSKDSYKYGYVTLPKTDSKILPIFSITVVLQILSLKMSKRKMEFLDGLKISNHGVHPDVPKNVSKSITVD
jgi:glucosamine 6-phosphate synthetase-like amidotransferase/phosphosugar isomerase protein